MNLVFGTICLVIFGVLGTWDKSLHHGRYALWLHPETAAEHRLHTWLAALFLPAVLLLFAVEASGPWLWAAGAAVAGTVVVSLLDTLEERRARVRFGGLSGVEACVHWLLGALKMSAFALALAARPAEVWLAGPGLVVRWDGWHAVGWLATAGALAALVEHLWLGRRGRLLRAAGG